MWPCVTGTVVRTYGGMLAISVSQLTSTDKARQEGVVLLGTPALLLGAHVTPVDLCLPLHALTIRNSWTLLTM